jgi:formate hydrogenlyase subunit 6/NADH:ubiquinone oxidoreductase subunit I
MTIGTMLDDIISSFFKRPVTQRYPFVKTPAPERYRGKVRWDPAQCSGCQLCVKDCPSYALELVVLDKATKSLVMRYHMARCTYCSQCVVSCRFGCLSQANDDWELAAPSRASFELLYGKDEDVQAYLAKSTPQEPVVTEG